MVENEKDLFAICYVLNKWQLQFFILIILLDMFSKINIGFDYYYLAYFFFL